MKKLILLLSTLFGSFISNAQSPITNGGFENWNTISFESPTFYRSSNEQNIEEGKTTLANVEKVKDAQSGTFAAKLTTILAGNDTLFAFFANGDPGQNRGGIPISGNPTAFTGYYKCDIKPTDTALVFVVCKLNGITISMNMKKIAGTTLNYTAFTMPITAPFAPDTVIVAAASSNAFSSKGIPGSTLFLDNLSFTGIVNQPSFLNGDFENWQTNSIDQLVGWYLNGSGNNSPKTTDKFKGAFAAVISTNASDNGPQVYGSSLSNSKWIQLGNNNGRNEGRPYSLTKDTLCGWYKFIATGIDSGSVNVNLTKNGSPIGGMYKGLPPTALYTYFEVPFSTFSAPDSIQIHFMSANGNNTSMSDVGSQLFLDEIILKSQIVKVTGNVTNVSCFGGSNANVVTTVSGGEIPYTYSWSNGASTSNLFNAMAGSYTLTVVDNVGGMAMATFNITQPNAINITPIVTPSACSGNTGSIDASAITGGTNPYTYSWSNNATTAILPNLISGSYTLSINDAAGCSAIKVVAVSDLNGPTINSLTVTNSVLCFGQATGGAVVNASSGTAPLTYLWSNGATAATVSGLTAGTYVVTVSDPVNCKAISSVIISQPLILAVAPSAIITPSCNSYNDGSIIISASGGVAPYNYVWSNSSTAATNSGLTAGTYSVTVVDANACSVFSTVVLTSPSAVLAFPSTLTSPSCNGYNDGVITVVGFGGTAPYNYTWNNGTVGATDNKLVAGSYSITVIDANGCVGSIVTGITAPPAIVITPTLLTSPSCNGLNDGAISLTATGTLAPYNYVWNTGSTNANLTAVSAGIYTVTVTDGNGCMKVTSVILSQPSALISNPTNIVTPLCNGNSNGSIEFSTTGGATGYTYTWSSGSTGASASGLIAGDYTVTITDGNNCSAITTVILSEPAVLSIYGTLQFDPSCHGWNDGQWGVAATGGTQISNPPYYNYLFSNGVTADAAVNINAGNHTVTVTDANGCKDSLSLTFNEPSPLVVSLDSVFNITSCSGDNSGAAYLSATGGNGGYSYSWQSTTNVNSYDTALYAGNQEVILIDALGCRDTAQFTITEPTPLVINVAQAGDSVTANATGGTAPYVYTWDNGYVGATQNALVAGSYTVTVIDASSCSAATTVIVVTGINEKLNNNALVVYPNPTTNLLNIVTTSTNGNVVLTIKNTIGQIVYAENVKLIDGVIKLDTELMPTGVYLIEMQNNGSIYRAKFMRN